MAKLSWNPPKWKSYNFDGTTFKVELETGEIFTGKLLNNYVDLKGHINNCFKLFGIDFSADKNHSKLAELSKVLDLNLIAGYWPEYHNVKEFIERYYERVAKTGNSSISKIYIETEFDITPKFTL